MKTEFIDQILMRLNENTPRIEKCLNLITEDEVWQRPNKNSNSIGNLIVHLCGNITQYVISSLGNTEDKRNRDYEFEISSGISKSDLLKQLQSTVERAGQVIEKLDKNNLSKSYSVQGFKLSGIGILIHLVEHFSYHTGQISFFTKLLKDKDLGYYADLDLNIKNDI